MSMTISPSLPVFDVDRLCRGVWGALFGQEIQGLRRDKRLSLVKSARRAGMTVAAWEAIEAGQVPQTWEQVCSLAEGLKKSRMVMASLVIRYAGAWNRSAGQDLPGEISRMYS
jgi:hypothetical protein